MSKELTKALDTNAPALTPNERKRMYRQSMRKHGLKGHAAPPGTGPAGETCKTCKYYTLKQLAHTYRKCGLMQQYWSGGLKTDIRAGDPACEKWEVRDGD